MSGGKGCGCEMTVQRTHSFYFLSISTTYENLQTCSSLWHPSSSSNQDNSYLECSIILKCQCGHLSQSCSLLPYHNSKAMEPAWTAVSRKWIVKAWYTDSVGFCWAIKKTDITRFPGKWMKLGGIILSTITQTWKDETHTSHLYILAYMSVCI